MCPCKSNLGKGFPEGYPRKAVSGKPAPDVQSAVIALHPFTSGLAVDGYSLTVSRSGGEGLGVKISAGPDACEDCLIPKEMFREMLASRLNSEGVKFSNLVVTYPND